MKLKEGFVLQKVGDDHVAVATGKASKSFNGLIRNNDTAAFIFEKLLQEITEEELIFAVLQKYDAPEEVVRPDVKDLLQKLREAGILDE